MDKRMFIYKSIQVTTVAALMASITACQKARMSSINRTSNPQVNSTPTGPRPVYPGQVTPGFPGQLPPTFDPRSPTGPAPSTPPPGVVTPPQPVVNLPQPLPTLPPVVTTLPERQTPPSAEPNPSREAPPAATSQPAGPGPIVVSPLPSSPASPPTSRPPSVETTPAPRPVVIYPGTTPPPAVPSVTTYPQPAVVSPPIPAPSAPAPGGINGGGGRGGTVITAHPSPMSGSGGLSTKIVDLSVPIIEGGIRLQTPIRSDIIATCGASPCLPPAIVFNPKCGEKGCPIETVQKTTERPVVSCPAIQLRERPYTNKLDILFVVDTSASMKEERVNIAQQMKGFIQQLSPDVEYRIAVMLGHGPRSGHIQVGELYSSKAKGAQYSVIQVDSLISAKLTQLDANLRSQSDAGRSPLPGVNDPLQKALTEAAVLASERLTEMMKSVPNDNSEAQGEAGLLNLYTAVSDSRKLQAMKNEGFWRDDAAKNIIFISDENDVCYDYQAHGQVGHYATEKDRQNETKAFNATDVCAQTAKGQRLTPEKVFAAVEASSQMPVIYSGVLYTDNNKIPKKSDRWSKDNEMGHGYLDLIALGKGKTLDLGIRDFGPGLAQMGSFTNFTMKYDHVFPMTGVQNVTDIDPKTIEVLIQDPDGKEQLFNASNVKLEIDQALNRASVVISYEVLVKVYEAGLVKEGAKIQIRYSTLSGKK